MKHNAPHQVSWYLEEMEVQNVLLDYHSSYELYMMYLDVPSVVQEELNVAY